MRSFNDADGRTWTLKLTTGHLEELRQIGFDFSQLAKSVDQLGTVLFGDPEKLVRAAWLLADPASKATNGVDVKTFSYACDGPTLEQAGEALVEALVDFFPRSRVAQVMAGRVKEALRALDEKILGEIPTIPAATPSRQSSASAGSSPASSASIPAR